MLVRQRLLDEEILTCRSDLSILILSYFFKKQLAKSTLRRSIIMMTPPIFDIDVVPVTLNNKLQDNWYYIEYLFDCFYW